MDAAEYALMDRAEDAMWWYRALHSRLATALSGVRGRVLDAGCGTGGFLALLHRTRPDLSLSGVEFDADAARRARTKARVAVARGSVNALPFATGAFDAVVSADVLCHAAVDPEDALAELARVLRPGGRLVINMPAYQWLLSAHDHRVHNVRRLSPGGLRGLLARAGFTHIRTRPWNAILLPLMVAQRKLLARSEDARSDVAPFSPWLDAIFHAATVIERPLRLPFGGSVLAIADRP